MKRFILTEEAEEHAFQIWKYLAAAADQRVADTFLAQIHDACDKLVDSPGHGHPDEDLLDERHRFYRVGSYRVVYRWQAQPLEVVAIVHGSRDLAAFFRDYK